jgi:type IV secretory pathway VirB3-like protein
METASFNGFIKMLFYIVAFYYIFKFLAKLFLPVLVKKVVEKAGQNFQQQYQNTQSTSNNRDEVIFDTAKATKPRETKKVGEYVDFEEID